MLAVPSGVGVLDVDLLMPAIVLAPGESFTWFFQLKGDTNSGPISGGAISDFYDDTRLSIILPPGFVPDDLQANDGTPGSSFAWLSVAPPVPGLTPPALIATALALGLAGMRMARRTAPLH